jgi:fructose-1,6-bisphosphatase/inositol monophosphatase family enzyme
MIRVFWSIVALYTPISLCKILTMNNNLTAINIIKTLLPTIKLAGDYACNIQSQIQAQPEKSEYGENFYATALTDADLTIQTTIELAILAHFPQLHFFGEEYEKSYNTKYFKSITFGDENEILVTLDPIDGTRPYLDGLPCFSIVLSIIKNRQYEGVFVLQPRRKHYFYALREKGAFIGNLDTDLSLAQPLKLQSLNSEKIYLSFALQKQREIFKPDFTTWCSATDYNPKQVFPDYLDFIKGNLAGFVIAKGNLIDSAAFAFICREAGGIVTNFAGQNFEPFYEVNSMRINGLIIAPNPELHQRILAKVNTF